MTNKFLKLCSLVLAVVMLVNMLPMESFAAELAAEDTAVAAQAMAMYSRAGQRVTLLI